MHLVILSQYFRPETGAPQNRLADLARRARVMGHQVTVVTAMPNYPSGTVRDGYRRRATAEEEIDGVRVLRSWISGHRGRGTSYQLFAYGSFALSSLLSAPWRVREADVLLWESPPLFLASTASALARRLGARIVMNVSDLWPESAAELGVLKDPRLVRVFMGMARRAYGRADMVLGQTEGILKGIGAVAPGTPATLFPNGVDCELFRPMPRDEALAAELDLPAGRAVVAYAGNFGRAQAIGQVTAAARKLIESRSDVVVLLIGDGPIKQQALADTGDLDPTRFLVRDSVDSGRMPGLLSLIDVAIVPLANQPIFEGARPSKMFELMACGVPFVFCGRGEGAELAARSGLAKVVPPESPDELAGAATELLELSPAERSRVSAAGAAWVGENFDRNTIVHGVVEQLEALGTPRVDRRSRRRT